MNSSICDGRGLAKRVVTGEDPEWIEYGTSTRFESGMFVAKVQGDSMAPATPSGAYCLFRKPPA
jgi:phage repressor protein C with HTH and peptisase S24 domain